MVEARVSVFSLSFSIFVVDDFVFMSSKSVCSHKVSKGSSSDWSDSLISTLEGVSVLISNSSWFCFKMFNSVCSDFRQASMKL